MQYSDYQNQTSSEKVTLAVMEASKRLMGWTLHSGSIYKLQNFPHTVIASIEDSGNAYTEAANLGAVTASKYFLDRDTQTLYIRTTGSDNPNGRFLACTLKLFFSNVPVTLPYDLVSGFEVYFEPLISSTSSFGVEIDTINQTSEAIEGSGSLTLKNDYSFWPSYFDKLSFENQRCMLYSYNRSLAASEARLLFQGRIETKSYGNGSISFKLKDQFSELRAPLTLPLVSSLAARTGDDIGNAYVRTILGRVFGHLPINTDQVLNGYPLTGTASVSYNSASVTGVGTAFLTELSPDDRVIIDGEEYVVASVSSNTAFTLTENYANALGASGITFYVLPDQPKRWINRTFKIANHALREPVTATEAGSGISQLILEDASDIFAGDYIYVGTLGAGELALVQSVSGNKLVKLATTLASTPAIGTTVRRPAVQNVRIDDIQLMYYRDYTIDASNALLTLLDTAEANADNIRQMSTNLTFTNGSRTVSGSSGLNTIIKPGYMVGIVGNANFFEVLSVADTSLELRSAANFTGTANGRYKALVYNHGVNTLSLDCLGRTDDGTSNGALLRTAPDMVKALLTDAGLAASIDTTSFTDANALAYQDIGIVIPLTFSDTKLPTYREVINQLNKSVFGNLVQTSEFKFGYHVLAPNKPASTTRFNESDVLSFTINATAENAVKTCIVQYRAKEYDYLTKKNSVRTKQQTSDAATHLLKTDRQKTFVSYLVEETDAGIMANRWSFLLETSAGKLNLVTKLQGASLEVGDIIDVEHMKFFERLGGSGKRKLMLVESVKKNGSEVHIEAVDLSNTFNRVAAINTLSTEFATSSEEDKLYGGFITDQYGLISDDPNSFGTNLIW